MKNKSEKVNLGSNCEPDFQFNAISVSACFGPKPSKRSSCLNKAQYAVENGVTHLPLRKHGLLVVEREHEGGIRAPPSMLKVTHWHVMTKQPT